MGHRLTKIYTRTGDDGATGLSDGIRVSKTHPRIEAIGEVDELNSVLGVLLAQGLDEPLAAPLTEVQHRLFDLGGELSMPEYQAVTAADVEALEQTIDTLNAVLAPLKDFVLPGGSATAATCHLARAVCRRAERRIVALAAAEPLRPTLAMYLNRLSDLLFVMARVLAGGREVLWRHGRARPAEGS